MKHGQNDGYWVKGVKSAVRTLHVDYPLRCLWLHILEPFDHAGSSLRRYFRILFHWYGLHFVIHAVDPLRPGCETAVLPPDGALLKERGDADDWRTRYDSVDARKQRLVELRGKTRADLSDEELWQKACLTEELIGPDPALLLYIACQVRHPDDPEAAFAIGRLLYRRGDERFLNEMKIALDEPSLAPRARDYAVRYLQAQGRHEEARRWRGAA